MSNDIPPSLSRFEGELERAIKRKLERNPATRRRWRARPRLIAGTTLGLAALATALALLFTAASSSPAFAVTRNHDGTVSVKLMRLEGLPAANAKLAAMHIHVKLVQVAVHCPSPNLPLPRRFRSLRPTQARIKPWRIPAGRTLVLGVQRANRGLHVAKARAVVGPVPACLPPIPLPCLLHKGRFTNRPLPLAASVSNRSPMRRLPAAACGKALRLTPVPGR